MKLVFEQTPEHFKSLQKNSLANFAFLKYALVGGIIMIITNIVLSSSKIGIPNALIIWLIIIFITIGLSYFMMRYLITRSLSKNRDQFLGTREMDISDEKIFYKTPHSESNMLWSGFSKMEESSICYFLYMGTQQAVIIPKSAFENNAQKSEFEKLAKSKIRK